MDEKEKNEILRELAMKSADEIIRAGEEHVSGAADKGSLDAIRSEFHKGIHLELIAMLAGVEAVSADKLDAMAARYGLAVVPVAIDHLNNIWLLKVHNGELWALGFYGEHDEPALRQVFNGEIETDSTDPDWVRRLEGPMVDAFRT